MSFSKVDVENAKSILKKKAANMIAQGYLALFMAWVINNQPKETKSEGVAKAQVKT